MTSDERARPHQAAAPSATGDRNPFDVSRRSEDEVAAEIAARLSAWKRARNGSGAPAQTPVTRPSLGMATPNMMVTPNASSHRAHGPQPMPRLGDPRLSDPRLTDPGEFARERRAPETANTNPQQPAVAGNAPRKQPDAAADAPSAAQVAARPVVTRAVVTSSDALGRAVPAAPSLGRPARAFPFRANAPRPAKPAAEIAPPPAAPSAIVEPAPAPVEVAAPSEIVPQEIEAPSVIEARVDVQAPAGIEVANVESAPADAPVIEQSAIEAQSETEARGETKARSDVPPVRRWIIKPRPIPAPMIKSREDEEAAVAAASIPRLAIPERIVVPMASRQAARGGTGWAMSLGAVLLFLGVTLPAALWQQPKTPGVEEAAVVASAPTVSQPAVSQPIEPAATAAPVNQPAAAPDTPESESAPVPSAFTTTAEQTTQHAQAPYEAPRRPAEAREIAAAPINMPTAAGALASAEPGDLSPADPAPTLRPFVPGAGASHVLVPPPGAVKKPVARLKPVASATVPPAVAKTAVAKTAVAKTAATKTATTKATAKAPAAKPVPQKPKPQTLEQMVDDLFNTLSNGQPPNPDLQPVPPGVRR